MQLDCVVAAYDNTFGLPPFFPQGFAWRMMCEWEDGTMATHYRGRKLTWHETQEGPPKPEQAPPKLRKPFTPPAVGMPDDLWRKSYQDMKPLCPPLGIGAQVSVASASALP